MVPLAAGCRGLLYFGIRNVPDTVGVPVIDHAAGMEVPVTPAGKPVTVPPPVPPLRKVMLVIGVDIYLCPRQKKALSASGVNG